MIVLRIFFFSWIVFRDVFFAMILLRIRFCFFFLSFLFLFREDDSAVSKFKYHSLLSPFYHRFHILGKSFHFVWLIRCAPISMSRIFLLHTIRTCIYFFLLLLFFFAPISEYLNIFFIFFTPTLLISLYLSFLANRGIVDINLI